MAESDMSISDQAFTAAHKIEVDVLLSNSGTKI